MNQETNLDLDGPVEYSDKEVECSSDDEDTPQVKKTLCTLQVLPHH